MKLLRNILIFAFACMTLSCKKEPEITIKERNRIEFQTSVNTKAYINDNSALQTQCSENNSKAINIYVKKTDDKKNSIYLNQKTNNTLEPKELKYNGNNWTYKELLYWGLNCTHDFLAVYQGASSHTFKQETDTYSINNITSSITDQNDILYARESVFFNTDQTSSKVNLVMKHALSAISVDIKNYSQKVITSATNITITGLYTKALQMDIPLICPAESDPVTIILGENPPKTDYKFNDVTNFRLAANSGAKQLLFGPIIILPQDFKKNEITLSFKINGNDDRTVKLSSIRLDETDREHAYAYRSGRHYRYTISISDDSINLNTEIVGWTDDLINLN